MTMLIPCMRCSERKECQLRQDKLKAIRPARVSSANWRCHERLAAWPVGARVSTVAVAFSPSRDPYDGGLNSSEEIEPGVVIAHPRELSGRITIRLDREIQGIGHPVQFVKRWPDQLTRLQGSVPVCVACQRPEVAHGYECDGDDDGNYD